MLNSRRARITVIASLLGLALVLSGIVFVTTASQRRVQAAVEEMSLNSPVVSPLYDLLKFNNAKDSGVKLNWADNYQALTDIRSRLSDGEWLAFLGTYASNVYPISSVVDTLPLEVRKAAEGCGAKYAQVLETTEWAEPSVVVNIFCMFIAKESDAAAFAQTSEDVLDHKTGLYLSTSFFPAVHFPKAESPYKVIRLGLPDPSFGPYPFIGSSQKMVAVVREPDAAFKTAAQLFSEASGQSVDESQVKYVFAPLNDRFADYYFEAHIGEEWYYVSSSFQEGYAGQGPTGNFTSCKQIVFPTLFHNTTSFTDVCSHSYSWAIR